MNRIGIGPLTAQIVRPELLADLEDRAKALGVIVSTHVRGSRFRTYRVTVHDYRRSIHLEGTGSLEAIIAGALDDWEEAWTVDELVTIAAQSGMAVRRA
jgi:hypothetical protein